MPPFSITKIIAAVLIAVIVGIALVGLLGPVLLAIHTPITEVLGRFFVSWGWAVGIVAGLWYYFKG